MPAHTLPILLLNPYALIYKVLFSYSIIQQAVDQIHLLFVRMQVLSQDFLRDLNREFRHLCTDVTYGILLLRFYLRFCLGKESCSLNTGFFLCFFDDGIAGFGRFFENLGLNKDGEEYPSDMVVEINVDEEKLDLLSGIQDSGKIVIVEYGIESCYDRTLKRINRGHDFACARTAVEMTAERGLTQCAHFIFGLPGESLGEMMDEAEIINSLLLTSVKFHQLQIIRGTAMEQEFREHREDFHEFTLDGYLDFMAEFIPRLRPDIYIDRFASEVPPRYLSPLQRGWGLIRYPELLDMLRKRMAMQQG